MWIRSKTCTKFLVLVGKGNLVCLERGQTGQKVDIAGKLMELSRGIFWRTTIGACPNLRCQIDVSTLSAWIDDERYWCLTRALAGGCYWVEGRRYKPSFFDNSSHLASWQVLKGTKRGIKRTTTMKFLGQLRDRHEFIFEVRNM